MKRKTRSSMKGGGVVPLSDEPTDGPQAASISETEEAGGNVGSAEEIVEKTDEEVKLADNVDKDNEEVGDKEEDSGRAKQDQDSQEKVKEVDEIEEMDNYNCNDESNNVDALGENQTETVTDKTDQEDQEQIVDEDGTQEENTSEDVTESDEIVGVIENPLFEPEESDPAPMEKFSVDDLNEDDLDFEPDIDESADKTPGWMDNVSSPKKVKDDGNDEEDDDLEVIDEVIISDTDDIDMLGDKIDAAYPGKKSKVLDDDESDEEKRGWRSEKSKSGDKGKSSDNRRSRISGPASKRQSRSSSIEIVSVSSKQRERRRISPLPNGRRLERSRSRDKYIRRSITPESVRRRRMEERRLEDLRRERMETERIRRQVRDLRHDLRDSSRDNYRDSSRDMFSGGYGGVRGGVRDRLGGQEQPRAQPRDSGYKLTVKNFPDSMSQSEFYSMFVRKGEMLMCEKKRGFGIVVFKTKASALSAVKDLNGTKNGNMTLSVREAPSEDPRPRRMDHGHGGRGGGGQERFRNMENMDNMDIPRAPPPPSGIFNRLGDRGDRDRGEMRTSSRVMEERFRGGDDFRDRMMGGYDNARGGMEDMGGGRGDFDNSYQRMASGMERGFRMASQMNMMDRLNMDGGRRMMNNFEDEDDSRFHERMIEDEQRSSMSGRMNMGNEGMMDNMGMQFNSRNMGMSSSQGMMGAMTMGMMSSRGPPSIMGMNPRNFEGIGMGSIDRVESNFMSGNMNMGKSSIGGSRPMMSDSDMNFNMRGRGDMRMGGITGSDSLDDMSNPFGSISNKTPFPSNMNSNRGFRSGLVIGGGGRGQGGFDPEEDTFGGNTGGRRDTFGGSIGGGGAGQGRFTSNRRGGSWSGNRGGGGHSTWSS